MLFLRQISTRCKIVTATNGQSPQPLPTKRNETNHKNERARNLSVQTPRRRKETQHQRTTQLAKMEYSMYRFKRVQDTAREINKIVSCDSDKLLHWPRPFPALWFQTPNSSTTPTTIPASIGPTTSLQKWGSPCTRCRTPLRITGSERILTLRFLCRIRWKRGKRLIRFGSSMVGDMYGFPPPS
jgi:hypothetical protein